MNAVLKRQGLWPVCMASHLMHQFKHSGSSSCSADSCVWMSFARPHDACAVHQAKLQAAYTSATRRMARMPRTCSPGLLGCMTRTSPRSLMPIDLQRSRLGLSGNLCTEPMATAFPAGPMPLSPARTQGCGYAKTSTSARASILIDDWLASFAIVVRPTVVRAPSAALPRPRTPP